MRPARAGDDALLGDVVAFTALPAVWVGQAPQDIARALADALDSTLFPSAVAVLMRAEHGLVEARAGEARLLDDDVRSWRAGRAASPAATILPIGPSGARGAIILHADGVEPSRLLLARLAANLADTALREAALQRQAAATREEVARMEKLSVLGQLVSGVAHELRTPLTYANNNVHLAKIRLARIASMPEEDRARIAALLDEILAAHERIQKTVSTLRQLSGSRVVKRERAELSEVVAEAARLFALTNVGPVQVARDLRALAHVDADRVEVQQVVLNLLQNAAEAMLHEGGVVRIATRDEDERVALVVEDDGPGIPADIRGRILEPFFTTKPTGTGLGLSIVRRIAEAHGASIEIGAATCGGAQVIVRFPVAAKPREVPVDAAPERGAETLSAS